MRRVVGSWLVTAVASVCAAGLAACGSSASSSSVTGSAVTGQAASGSGSATAQAAAAGGSAASGLTRDGATLKLGQTAWVDYAYTGPSTGPYELTVTVKRGSISDLSDFDLDAQSKLGVPFYVTQVVKNVGTKAGTTSGWGGALTVRNAAGDEIDDITLLGDFPTCQGNPPDKLAPGKQFTECDVYIAPSGQSVASVEYENYDDAGNQQTVTWKP